MAKTPETPEKETTPVESEQTAAPAERQAPPQRPQVQVDDTKAVTC